MANYILTSSENSTQIQEKSDTLEKKWGLHSFKYKGMSVCTSYLAADSSYSKTNPWRIYKTELKRTESGISTELCPPNLLISRDICDTKASQGIRTPNNAVYCIYIQGIMHSKCARETVSQMGYTCFLGRNVLAIMPYFTKILVNFWNDKGVPVKNLAAYTYLWQIQESHLLNHLKRIGFYYTTYLSV